MSQTRGQTLRHARLFPARNAWSITNRGWQAFQAFAAVMLRVLAGINTMQTMIQKI
jgi:hypothetical protein